MARRSVAAAEVMILLTLFILSGIGADANVDVPLGLEIKHGARSALGKQ